MEWRWDQSFAFGSTLAEKPELAPGDGKSCLPQTGGTRQHTGRKGCTRGEWVKKLKDWGRTRQRPLWNIISNYKHRNSKKTLRAVLKYWEYKINFKTESSQAHPPPKLSFSQKPESLDLITVLLPTLPCYTATKTCVRSGSKCMNFYPEYQRLETVNDISCRVCGWLAWRGRRKYCTSSEVGLK